jgi:hypothetical protein
MEKLAALLDGCVRYMGYLNLTMLDAGLYDSYSFARSLDLVCAKPFVQKSALLQETDPINLIYNLGRTLGESNCVIMTIPSGLSRSISSRAWHPCSKVTSE